MAPLGSKTSKTGDTFPIRLAQPVVIDGVELLPTGVTGIGEVIHAAPSGFGGSAGELVVTARYLDFGPERIRLRSMRVSAIGKDQTGLSMAATVAVGVFGLAIKGKNSELPAGTMAEAKLATALTVTKATAAAQPAPLAAPLLVPESTQIQERGKS